MSFHKSVPRLSLDLCCFIVGCDMWYYVKTTGRESGVWMCVVGEGVLHAVLSELCSDTWTRLLTLTVQHTERSHSNQTLVSQCLNSLNQPCCMQLILVLPNVSYTILY